MPSDRIHAILNDRTDKKSILQFEAGTNVDLNDIKVGDQLYYLYEAEEDKSSKSWYWGMFTLYIYNTYNTYITYIHLRYICYMFVVQ